MQLTIYSKPGCHLCDEMKALVRRVLEGRAAKPVYLFIRRRGKFKELQPAAGGIFRSEVFPGLWLDPAALLREDRRRLLTVLRQGLASPEHAAFVAKLAAKRGR